VDHKKDHNLSRRQFLTDVAAPACGLAICPLLASLTGSCTPSQKQSPAPKNPASENGSPEDPLQPNPSGPGTHPPGANSTPYDVWIAPLAKSTTYEDTIRAVCASMDFSWLKKGDTVLVKVSSHSPNEHPSVTSPFAIRAVCAELKARGAGRILVGDQSGIMYVRSTAQGKNVSSTLEVFAKNGILNAIKSAGCEAVAFEARGFAEGYFRPQFNFKTSWPDLPFITSYVKEVDHIIYLPRISSHVLTGYTHGHKITVGFLREDSRHLMHRDAATLHEKYTELNYCEEIRSRFRFALTVATGVLLKSGPDQGSLKSLNPGVVVASPHLPSHDAVTVALLAHYDREGGGSSMPSGIMGVAPYGTGCDMVNRAYTTTMPASVMSVPFNYYDQKVAASTLPYHDFKSGIKADRPLSRGFNLNPLPMSQGAIKVNTVVAALPAEVQRSLSQYGGGVLKLG
jgi:uncharacterized protein (DUF362 family)